jgi:hypothetical protein
MNLSAFARLLLVVLVGISLTGLTVAQDRVTRRTKEVAPPAAGSATKVSTAVTHAPSAIPAAPRQ